MEIFIDRLEEDGTTTVVSDTTTGIHTSEEDVVSMSSTTTHDDHQSTSKTATYDHDQATLAHHPIGKRWAISSSEVDLSGHYELMVTPEFKKRYDEYLERLGQPSLVRSIALNVAKQTTEEIIQLDSGRSLMIVGRNIKGIWSRTLVASGTDLTSTTDGYRKLKMPITSADSERVECESWWENEGTVHVSWIRGVTRYGGGQFESRRYLEGGGGTYVCESTFHPNDPGKPPNSIVWKFQKTTRATTT
jgi:hypothetical protein